MRIAIGSLQCEGNSLTPIHTRFEDFDYAVGEAMYDEVQVVNYFKEHKCGVVPTIYAHALPGGAVVKKDFLRLVNELVDEIPTEGIDGIWLYLHGAMYVEGIGSGDTYLLQKIRDKVGYNIPISVAMDFHADNTDEIIKNACDACYLANIGDTLTLKVGGSLDANSETATITGKLIHRGDIISYTGGNAGPSATLDCGDMTVVITKNRAAMCRPDIFESVDLDYSPYKIVVVKLGYLFPELAAKAERAILAFTPGSSTERLEDMNMKKIRRPMFPLDDDFR